MPGGFNSHPLPPFSRHLFDVNPAIIGYKNIDMKKDISLTLCAFLVPVLVLSQTGPAFAYLDPGTGSILIQGLLGAIAGGIVMARLYWARIKTWFSPDTTNDEEGPGEG